MDKRPIFHFIGARERLRTIETLPKDCSSCGGSSSLHLKCPMTVRFDEAKHSTLLDVQMWFGTGRFSNIVDLCITTGDGIPDKFGSHLEFYKSIIMFDIQEFAILLPRLEAFIIFGTNKAALESIATEVVAAHGRLTSFIIKEPQPGHYACQMQ